MGIAEIIHHREISLLRQTCLSLRDTQTQATERQKRAAVHRIARKENKEATSPPSQILPTAGDSTSGGGRSQREYTSTESLRDV